MAKKIYRSPILPIAAGAAIAGLAKQMTFVISGVSLFTFILICELWPWATWISVKVANDHLSMFSGPKRTAEVSRRKKQRMIQRATFILFCVASATLGILASRWAMDNHTDELREQANLNLKATLSMPSEHLLKNLRFTISNDGSEDIYLVDITCLVRQISSKSHGELITNVALTMPQSYLKLRRGGDQTSMNCPSEDGARGAPLLLEIPKDDIACGDVLWTVRYGMPKQQNYISEKKFHFILKPNESDWSPRGITEQPYKCS